MFGTANVLSLGQGTSMGWLSPSLPLLMADDSPLPSGPITNYDVGWIGSLVSLGAIFGTLIFGLLANRIGTKYALMSCPIPMFVGSYVLVHIFHTFFTLSHFLQVSWTIVIFATEAWHLYVGRFFVGFTGGGLYICYPMFIAEISSDQ